MLKPVLTLAALGVAGVAVWQLLWLVLLPLVGTVLGFLVTAMKIALVVVLVLIAIWLLRKPRLRQV